MDRHGGGGGKGPVLPLSPFSVAPMVVDYPWDWFSPQLLNHKGEEIYYPFVDDNDRSWARRLEWAINHHRDLAQSDLNGLQGECERVLRRSQSAAVRRDERYYIKSLQSQLDDAHKRLRDART